MNKDDYKWYLKDPRWIEYANYIKIRDGCCQKCGSITFLHAHHLRYFQMRMPWDYPEHYLITLCGDCHKYEHERLKELHRMFKDMIYTPFWADDLIDRLKGIPD